MGLFSKKEEPIRRDKVSGLLKALMERTDLEDREHSNSGQWSARVQRAQRKVQDLTDGCTEAEKNAAYEAKKRHGY